MLCEMHLAVIRFSFNIFRSEKNSDKLNLLADS